MPGATADGSRRVEVAGERLPGWIERFGSRHQGLTSTVVGTGSDQLVRLDAGDGSWAEVDVPWPPLPGLPSPDLPDGPIASLLAHVAARRRLALLLVRKGGFAVGVLDPEGLTRTKVGSRHVQGRTKAGGWSQQRYARRRAHQARQASEAAADVAARVLLPVVESLDGLVPGGDRQAVADVLSDRRLGPLGALPHSRFLAVPDPRRAVLDTAAADCRLVVLHVVDVTRTSRS